MRDSDSTIPRRIDRTRHTPAERAITDAMLAVEELPADVRLTRAVILLGDARDRVADYVDGVNAPVPGNGAEPEWVTDHIKYCYRKVDDYQPPTAVIAVLWLQQRRLELIQSVMIERDKFAQETLRASNLADRLDAREREKKEMREVIGRLQARVTKECARAEQAERERDEARKQITAINALAGEHTYFIPSFTTASGAVAPALGGCTCYASAPTIPTCRDRMTHLSDCPAKDSGYPCGTFKSSSRESADHV